ncbi:MAG: hypothetical protein DI616_19855 [Paracoccus denitrificans]|uniref:Uncharacterized protein n=1 Tax=Paracoccus denitrificans TaxID=266 RepID=A0A533HXV6_PARDE|nr:MAG: hypothetical protein DI616_19855 [Paracoccus denitrificans]
MQTANAAARFEPRREGYCNAIQIYPWSKGALYQVCAAVGQITTIALELGERQTGASPIAAGDTARRNRRHGKWVRCVCPRPDSVKPARPDIANNHVAATDRRSYLIELQARGARYMTAVAWVYPATPATRRSRVAPTFIIPAEAARNQGYGLTGDSPPWKPKFIFDDGVRVYVVFPRGIGQGEMPPLFVIGASGEAP